MNQQDTKAPREPIRKETAEVASKIVGLHLRGKGFSELLLGVLVSS
jgi:hypothetical protein